MHGLVNDFGACGIQDSLSIETVDGIFSQWTYLHKFPAGSQCVATKNIIDFDLETYQFGINFDPYFTKPSSCASPLSYCDAFYQTNACTN